MAAGRTDDDPLSKVLAPPPDESPADKEARLLAEAEAKRISDAIDEELQQQARAEKKGPRPMKMLLLGEYPCVMALSDRHRDGICSCLHRFLQTLQGRVNQVRTRHAYRAVPSLITFPLIRQIHHVEE